MNNVKKDQLNRDITSEKETSEESTKKIQRPKIKDKRSAGTSQQKTPATTKDALKSGNGDAEGKKPQQKAPATTKDALKSGDGDAEGKKPQQKASATTKDALKSGNRDAGSGVYQQRLPVKADEEEIKRRNNDDNENTRSFWNRFIRSLGEVFKLDQIIYGFNWLLVLAIIFIHDTTDIIKWFVCGTLGGLSIYRIGRVIWHYKHPNKIRKKPYIPYILEGIIVVALLCCIICQTEKYSPAPVRRLVFSLLLSFSFSVINAFIPWKRLKYACMNILVFLCALIMSQVIHYAYIDLDNVRICVDNFFISLLPRSNGAFTGDIQWLSLGLPLFASCLIIINWFKDRPCQTWNPYTVQEIGLCDHVVYFAVMLISSLFYCGVNNMKRMPIVPLIGILLLNIYAMYLKNTQNLDSLVMRKVIQKTEVKALVDTIVFLKEKKSQTIEWNGNIKKQMNAFSHSIKMISRTILTSDVSIDDMATNYKQVVQSIYELVPEDKMIYSTVGFVFGLSSASLGLMGADDKNKGKIISAFQTINNRASKGSLINDPLYKMLRTGLWAGFAKAKKDDIVNGAFGNINKYRSKPKCEYQRQSEDYIKFIEPEDEQFFEWLDKWIKETDTSTEATKTVDWEWVNEVWQEIK